MPRYLLAERTDGTLIGAAPSYVKTHSRGEYVFDHGWADAYEHAGGAYYPKLQVSVPFTPVTGPRLLARPGPQAPFIRETLGEALSKLADANNLSSAHVTFLTEPEWRLLGEQGYLQRTDQQFHFENPGYTGFEDFLGELSSRKRKTIRRERKDALSPGIDIVWLTGSDLTEDAWDAFFAFYMDTGSRKWGQPYLTRDGFSRASARPWRIASCSSWPAAPAAISPAPSISSAPTRCTAATGAPSSTTPFCISRSVTIRPSTSRSPTSSAGSRPAPRASTSWRAATCPTPPTRRITFPNPGLRRAIAQYLKRERAYVEAASGELAAAAPFRKDLDEQE